MASTNIPDSGESKESLDFSLRSQKVNLSYDFFQPAFPRISNTALTMKCELLSRTSLLTFQPFTRSFNDPMKPSINCLTMGDEAGFGNSILKQGGGIEGNHSPALRTENDCDNTYPVDFWFPNLLGLEEIYIAGESRYDGKQFRWIFLSLKQ